MTTTEPAQRDVFVVFSKSEPIEARFALAIKDGLEQLGRFAYEYEDWAWFEDQAKASNGDTEVDRTTLRLMLQRVSVVMVIPPRGDKTSQGVSIELDLLAELQIPVLMLQWDYPYRRFERPDLNVIDEYQVHGSMPKRSMDFERGCTVGGACMARVHYFRATHEARTHWQSRARPITSFRQQTADELQTFGGESRRERLSARTRLPGYCSLSSQCDDRGSFEGLDRKLVG